MPTLTFAETKGVCEIAYDGERGDSYRFPDGSTWSISKAVSDWMSGFKAVVASGNEKTVLSFAGTDSAVDVAVDIAQVFGGLPAQYQEALLLTGVEMSRHSQLILAGHSLGGGLAAYCSVQTRLRAYTVNPAPLIGALTFSGLGENSQITNFVAQGGEIVSSSPGRNPGIDIPIPSSGNILTRHSLANVGPSTPLPVKI
jgi:Mbeg1-like